MKRWLLPAGLLVVGFLAVQAQEPAGAKPAAAHEEAHAHQALWKWVNLAILLGGLGYLAAKRLPAFFEARGEAIRQGIADAAKLKQEAEARAARMEARLARLEEEVAAIRQSAQDEMAKEGERIRLETAQHLARLDQQGEQEIAALSNHAVRDLKIFTAQLAIQLAEQRVISRLTPPVQNELIDRFVQDLDHQGARGAVQ
jgi:F-type H+-transporting ATPase subunit b